MKIVNVKTIGTGVKVAAGFAAGSLIVNAVGKGGAIGAIVPFVAAGLLGGFLGAKMAPVATGMVAFGTVNALRQFAPQIASQVGLSGIGAYLSTDVNLLAGAQYNGIPSQVPNTLVVE